MCGTDTPYLQSGCGFHFPTSRYFSSGKPVHSLCISSQVLDNELTLAWKTSGWKKGKYGELKMEI